MYPRNKTNQVKVILPFDSSVFTDYTGPIVGSMLEGMFSGDESCVFNTLDSIAEDFAHDEDAARKVYAHYEESIIQSWAQLSRVALDPTLRNIWDHHFLDDVSSLGSDSVLTFLGLDDHAEHK